MDGFSMLLVAATFSSAASFSLGRVPMPTAPSAVRMSAIDDAEVSAHADRMHGLDHLRPCCAHPAAPTLLLPPCWNARLARLPPCCAHPAAPTLLLPPFCFDRPPPRCGHPAAPTLRPPCCAQPHCAICTPQAKARWLAGSGTPSWGVSEVDEAAELISKLKIEVSDAA